MTPLTDAADPLANWPSTIRRALPRLVIGALLGGLALWLAFRGVDAAALGAALRTVNYWWVGASFISVVLTTLVVTARWRMLFYPDHARRSWLVLLGGILVGQMLNILVPARLGDVARVYLVGTSEGLSKTRIAVTLVVEKMADLLVFALATVGLLVAITVPDWVRQSSASLLITSLVGLAAIVVLCLWGPALLTWVERHTPARAPAWVQRVWRLGRLALEGLTVLRSWQANLALWSLTALSWFLAASTNYLLFLAFGFPLSFAAAGFVLVVLQVGTAPPSLPGKVGVFHYLTVLALTLFGVAHSAALTYALVLYGVALLSKVLVGGIWLAWLRWLPAPRPSATKAA